MNYCLFVAMPKRGQTQKPTVKHLYYLLGNISHHWYKIGVQLKMDTSTLNKIKADFEGEMSDRRMIEMFDCCIESTPDLNWSTVIEALRNVNEESLADKVLHYTLELGRIEKFPFHKYCKSFSPLKEYCYEDTELEKRYFQTDKLSHASITNSRMEIIKCLMPRSIKWYEMGILFDVSKARLDDIHKKYKHHESTLALIKMVDALIEECGFTCTWRKVIDALLEMNFTSVAKAVESLALEKCGLFNNMKSKLNLGESKLNLEESRESSNEEKKMYVTKIRRILGLPIHSVSDKDENILDNLYKHIRTANPSHTELKKITVAVEKISELYCDNSKELADQAKELREDLQRVDNVRSQLSKEERRLKLRKGELEDNSREISKEISTLKNGDQNGKKVKLLELEGKNKEALQQLQEVCKQLKDCIEKLMQANASYNSIEEQLTVCRQKLNTCKRNLKACKRYITDVQDNFPGISEVEDAISETLDEIDIAHSKIDETQEILENAEHPYVDERLFKSADPFKCHAYGKGTEGAAVGEKVTAVLQVSNFMGEPCEAKEIMCEIVSKVAGARESGHVDQVQGGEYGIQYMPTVRGRHELTVTVNGIEINGSPFLVFVSISPSQLGKPVQVIHGHGEFHFPRDVGITAAGSVVMVGGNQVVILDRTGKRLKTIEKIELPDLIFGVCVDAVSGCAYITGQGSAEQGMIVKLSSQYTVLRQACHFKGLFYGVALVGGEVMVCDGDNECIEVYTSELQHLRQISLPGKQLYDLSSDEHDNLFVSDLKNACIHVLSTSGDLIRSFGWNLEKPLGVCVYGVYVYVTDKNNHNISMFTTAGEHVTSFGQFGNEIGEFKIPWGVCVDKHNGFVYMCDFLHHQILKM